MFEEIEIQLLILLDVAIAAAICSIIGYEREKSQKPAGLRTNMIVGSISCFFVAISPELSGFIEASIGGDNTSVDPVRILQAIIVGVSFIGAGTILKSNNESNVYFLTTAATLLYSSGIGIAVALGDYIIAAGLAILALLINLLNDILSKFNKNSNHNSTGAKLPDSD